LAERKGCLDYNANGFDKVSEIEQFPGKILNRAVNSEKEEKDIKKTVFILVLKETLWRVSCFPFPPSKWIGHNF
jgi:hypothetical protein